MFRVPGVAIALIVGLSMGVSAQTTTEVRLAWDASSDPAVAGYVIDYGTASGVYSQSIGVGNVLQYTVTGLLFGKSYYFTVRAYDGNGAFSARSNEVSFTTPTAPSTPPPPGTPPPPPVTCVMTFSTTTETLKAAGGTANFKLTTSTGCAWTVDSSAEWVSVQNPNGTGTQVVNYFASPNLSKEPRAAILYSGPRSVIVNQRGKVKSDFDGDGLNDLIWQNRLTGELSVWRMNGTTIKRGDYLTPASVGDTNWKILGVMDADRDGHADLVLQHDAGQVAIWRMEGETRVQTVQLSTNVTSDPRWRIVGTGDMDKDEHEDIFWQHTDGRVMVWYMTGLTRREAVVIATVQDPRWRLVGIEDFNYDGKLDVLWRHTQWGQFLVWHMNDRQYLSAGMNLIMANHTWEVAAVGDYSGDGKADLIWRNTVSGELATWFLDGGNILASRALNPGQIADVNWLIAGPR